MDATEIEALRKAMGLTQAAFGAKLGVTAAQVSKYESGHRKPGGAVKILLGKLAKGTRK